MTDSVCADREELARQVWPLARRKAVGYARRYPHLDPQEFESAAGAAVAEALDTFDPGRGVTVRQHVTMTVRARLKDALRAATKGRGDRGNQGLLVPFPRNADGQVLEPADRRAADPAALAAAAEGFPDPALVAAQAARLKAATLAALTPQDVADVVRAVVDRAKGGHVPSATLVLALAGRG